MANQAIRTPRFYTDITSFLMSRGSAQSNLIDVKSTGGSGATATRGIQTGSEAELFDMRPLNKVDFDTSGDTDSQVLIALDASDFKKSYIAILNHNLVSAAGKIRIFAGNHSTDVDAVDGTAADTADIDWSDVTITEVVNADAIAETGISDAAYDDRSVVIEPATDGSTIFKFDETSLRYWGIQFEGKTSDTSATHHDGTWGSTDLFVGCIMIGEYYDMPHAPDLAVKRSIIYDHVDVQESLGGQRFGNMVSKGRTGTTTTKSPFNNASYNNKVYGGRLAFDMSFSYLSSTDLMPDRYHDSNITDDAVVEDVWNKTNGPQLPFIFSIDKDSEGNNAESEHIFARFAQNSLDMTQVANDVFNISMRIEEEF
jgi:uncharacterized protein YrzB (UPF0473 family)|tara:strand:- start:175 stop:1284 length:1110 start_codon:yes stop_codon:yes gene_type:complete